MTVSGMNPSDGRPATLAIDIGGSGLKATVLDSRGEMMAERVRIATPRPIDPAILVDALAELVEPCPAFDRVSVGFPGVVRDGVIRTAENLGTEKFAGFNLAGALEERFAKPVRVINDADMQGYGAIRGKGVEMVITLGTGLGSALFMNGRLAPHLELAHHPFHRGRSYEHELGEAARRRFSKRKWNKRVREAIERLRALTNFDHLYIGGGNAKKLEIELPADVTVVDNTAGVLGGIKLWESEQ
jgi:polyphosphate glucokinase